MPNNTQRLARAVQRETGLAYIKCLNAVLDADNLQSPLHLFLNENVAIVVTLLTERYPNWPNTADA